MAPGPDNEFPTLNRFLARMKFHGSAAKQKPEESVRGADSVETLTVFSSIPVTQMPGIPLSLAQGSAV